MDVGWYLARMVRNAAGLFTEAVRHIAMTVTSESTALHIISDPAEVLGAVSASRGNSAPLGTALSEPWSFFPRFCLDIDLLIVFGSKLVPLVRIQDVDCSSLIAATEVSSHVSVLVTALRSSLLLPVSLSHICFILLWLPFQLSSCQ